jgi:hypothetical protein
MQDAETVLSVLRERGREGLPCDELYRQMFNKSLYLLAYGNIYSNQGAMTPGTCDETADGMSEAKIHTASGKGVAVIPRCGRYRKPGPGLCGSSRVTSLTASAARTMRSS